MPIILTSSLFNYIPSNIVLSYITNVKDKYFITTKQYKKYKQPFSLLPDKLISIDLIHLRWFRKKSFSAVIATFAGMTIF